MQRFNNTVERACLRRDAYLDQVFAHEAKALKEEIPGPNSAAAKAFLQSQLENLRPVAVNFSLSRETIDAVKCTCKELNVIRDCFINRVLFLLCADDRALDAITGVAVREYFGDIVGRHDRDFLYADLSGGSLSAISDIVRSDPFRVRRAVIEHARASGDEAAQPLHACLILPELFRAKPAGAIALNCYLPDAFVPGTPAAEEAEDVLDLFVTDVHHARAQALPELDIGNR